MSTKTKAPMITKLKCEFVCTAERVEFTEAVNAGSIYRLQDHFKVILCVKNACRKAITTYVYAHLFNAKAPITDFKLEIWDGEFPTDWFTDYKLELSMSSKKGNARIRSKAITDMRERLQRSRSLQCNEIAKMAAQCKNVESFLMGKVNCGDLLISEFKNCKYMAEFHIKVQTAKKEELEIAAQVLRPWQSKLYSNVIDNCLSSFNVTWVTDLVGDAGKSWFCHQYLANKDDMFTYQYFNDLSEFKFKLSIFGPVVNGIFIDICRAESNRLESTDAMDIYYLVEFIIKELKMSCPIVLFANILPNLRYLSLSKWQVFNIVNGELAVHKFKNKELSSLITKYFSD